MSEGESALMTPYEVRREFFGGRLGRNKLYELVKRGDLPAVRLGDRIYFSRKRLTDLFEGQKQPGRTE